MRKLLTVFITFLTLINVSGQQTEFRISLNSGLFSFSGASAVSVTSLIHNDPLELTYINDQYGSKSGLCYGIVMNLERVTRGNFILGLEAGFESLQSKVAINHIYGDNGSDTYQYDATGKGYMGHEFLNSYPFIGYRLVANTISLDLTGGFDFGFALKIREKGNATAVNGIKYTVSVTRSKDTRFDLRPRIQLSAYYGRTGIYLGYSYGLINYQPDLLGSVNNEAFARLIRFGITYRIK